MKLYHGSIVAVEVPRILCRYYGIGEDEALKRFYESATGADLADEATGLYGQSALHIAGLFIEEQDGDIDCSRLQCGREKNDRCVSDFR